MAGVGHPDQVRPNCRDDEHLPDRGPKEDACEAHANPPGPGAGPYDQGPDQVEMLLDGQGPEVDERKVVTNEVSPIGRVEPSPELLRQGQGRNSCRFGSEAGKDQEPEGQDSIRS